MHPCQRLLAWRAVTDPRARITVLTGDITRLDVDAIVNAANSSLLGGGGVDGAIHRAAGPMLLEECRTLGGAHTGEVKMTAGYELPARHVLHAVGPVWRGGQRGERGQLRHCYVRSCELAAGAGLKTLAFPAISTGAYRFPLEEATRIAVKAVLEQLEQHPELEVTFCCFSDRDRKTYEKVLDEVLAGH